MKKKMVIFSGSGLDAESGVSTFRDIENGLWYNYEVDKVATKEGWKKDRELVLEFHNMLRGKLHEVNPNDAHHVLKDLEDKYDVTHVTQNVTDLLERAKCDKVYHIHGELMKCRSSLNPKLIYDCRGSINIGDKCELGSQLRPHTVLFGEYPYNFDVSQQLIKNCDILLIIGCSFEITYTPSLVKSTKKGCKVIEINPEPSNVFNDIDVTIIKESAVNGLKTIIKNNLI